MASLNRAMLIGHLGRDPEIKNMQNGGKIANLSVATSERWRDKGTGERREKTEWHRVVVFNENLVEIIRKYAVKGSKVYLEGKLQTRKWTDQKGNERYTTEIVLANFDGKVVLLDSAGERQDNHGEDDGKAASQQSSGGTGGDLDDDIPF